MRLSPTTLDRLSAAVARPAFDRAEQAIGILHLGLGAFHRAHQAVYTDAAMSSGDRDWGIAGVSLRSRSVRDKLQPQAGLYTVTQTGVHGETTALIGALKQALVAGEDESTILDLLADASVQIVSLTVTEKGYHRSNSGELDFSAIASDLRGTGLSTIYGILGRGLSARRAAGLGGLTILSCDNLAENGSVLRNLLLQFLSRTDPALGSWVEAECAFPCTMVDRIVPATTDEQVETLERKIGLRDEAAVFTEPFSQWVIEDRFAGRRPAWEAGGAEFVADVREYETAKLRMLNGAHSALAYLGLEHGHEFVHEAIADPQIRTLVEQILRDEAPSTLSGKFDSSAYADRLLERFGNPAVKHRLAQIAMDGSQKIPQRWLATLAQRQRKGLSSPALLTALAAWVRHVGSDTAAVDDPMSAQLSAIWQTAGIDGIIPALFGYHGMFAQHWVASEQDCAMLTKSLR